MPAVFHWNGFRFFFFSNEGDPRFWLSPVALATSDGFDARTLRELAKIIENDVTLIEGAWHEHFG